MERKKSALKFFFFFFKAAKQHQKFRILPWSARFVAVATQTRLLPPRINKLCRVSALPRPCVDRT